MIPPHAEGESTSGSHTAYSETTSFSIVIVGPGIVDPGCWDGAFARPQRMVHQPPYEPDCRVQLRTM